MFSISNWGSETQSQSHTTALIEKGLENTVSANALLDRAPANSSSSDTDTVDPHALLSKNLVRMGVTDDSLDLI